MSLTYLAMSARSIHMRVYGGIGLGVVALAVSGSGSVAVYSAAKEGVIAFTRPLARELWVVGLWCQEAETSTF